MALWPRRLSAKRAPGLLAFLRHSDRMLVAASGAELPGSGIRAGAESRAAAGTDPFARMSRGPPAQAPRAPAAGTQLLDRAVSINSAAWQLGRTAQPVWTLSTNCGGSCLSEFSWRAQARGAATAASSKAQAAKKGKGATGAAERNPREALLEACLRAEPAAVIGVAEETLAADAVRAKEYSRLMLQVHRAQQLVQSKKLKYKKAAIDAIPEGKLKEAAIAPDYTPFPKKMYAPSLTPPVLAEAEELVASRAKPVKKIR